MNDGQTPFGMEPETDRANLLLPNGGTGDRQLPRRGALDGPDPFRSRGAGGGQDHLIDRKKFVAAHPPGCPSVTLLKGTCRVAPQRDDKGDQYGEPKGVLHLRTRSPFGP